MGCNSTSRLVSRFTGNSLLPVLQTKVIQEVQVLPASLISEKEKENHATTQDPRPTTLAATGQSQASIEARDGQIAEAAIVLDLHA